MASPSRSSSVARYSSLASLERGAEVLHDVAAPGRQLVGGLEGVVDVDRQALGGQVSDVAHRGAHVELVAQETGDRLGLGWRFHDDERSGHRWLGKRAFTRACQGDLSRHRL